MEFSHRVGNSKALNPVLCSLLAGYNGDVNASVDEVEARGNCAAAK